MAGVLDIASLKATQTVLLRTSARLETVTVMKLPVRTFIIGMKNGGTNLNTILRGFLILLCLTITQKSVVMMVGIVNFSI